MRHEKQQQLKWVARSTLASPVYVWVGPTATWPNCCRVVKSLQPRVSQLNVELGINFACDSATCEIFTCGFCCSCSSCCFKFLERKLPPTCCDLFNQLVRRANSSSSFYYLDIFCSASHYPCCCCCLCATLCEFNVTWLAKTTLLPHLICIIFMKQQRQQLSYILCRRLLSATAYASYAQYAKCFTYIVAYFLGAGLFNCLGAHAAYA